MPVDTHVHQIAIKHYSLRGTSSKQKQSMNPRLYDEVQKKLARVWGPWAGWTQTVLFTADLKAFEKFDSSSLTEPQILQLPTPHPSPARVIQNPEPTKPSPRVSKKRRIAANSVAEVSESRLTDSVLLCSEMEGSSAERVKRRRRIPE